MFEAELSPLAPDDAVQIREGVRNVCRDFNDRYWRECDEGQAFPWAFYTALAEGGWIGVALPEEYGGGGRGITEASIVLEEIAASGAATNGCSAIHLSIFGMNPVVKHGSEEMRTKYLPRIANGDLHVAFGVTEADAGTETTAIRTFARRVDGGYRVRGQKIWTTKASLCEKVPAGDWIAAVHEPDLPDARLHFSQGSAHGSHAIQLSGKLGIF